MSGPVYTAYCAATAMSERVHAAAIVEAVEAAEQVEATPAALMALLRDLQATGVGHGENATPLGVFEASVKLVDKAVWSPQTGIFGSTL